MQVAVSAPEATTPAPEPTGPAAILAVFVTNEECRGLKHECCSRSGCPCNDARAWIRSLAKTTTWAQAWDSCPDATWLRWCALRALPTADVPSTPSPDEFREALPAHVVRDAFLNPKPSLTCDDCGEETDPDELVDGRCDSCDSEYEWCSICRDHLHRDDLCRHLVWSDVACEVVGAGAGYHDVAEGTSIWHVLNHLGRRWARRLRAAVASCQTDRWSDHSDLGEILDCLKDQDIDETEIGLLFLSTLDEGEEYKAAIDATLGRIDAHLLARDAAIAADRRRRRVIRDGGGRYYVPSTGLWSAVRAQAEPEFLSRREAAELAKKLGAIHGTKIVPVHVLPPPPPPPPPDRGAR